jgi:hypothetical protein
MLGGLVLGLMMIAAPAAMAHEHGFVRVGVGYRGYCGPAYVGGYCAPVVYTAPVVVEPVCATPVVCAPPVVYSAPVCAAPVVYTTPVVYGVGFYGGYYHGFHGYRHGR